MLAFTLDDFGDKDDLLTQSTKDIVMTVYKNISLAFPLYT